MDTHSLIGCNAADSHRRCTNIIEDHIFAVFGVDCYSGHYTLNLQGVTLEEMGHFCQNK